MTAKFNNVLWGLVRIVRPHQWSKNLFVLAPLVFSKELGIISAVMSAFLAAFLFCLASGAVYTMNDMVDAPRDRLHPVKKNRPIASGMLPVEIASAYGVFLAGISIGASIYFGYEFVVTLLIYLVLNIVYSFWLKKIVIVDVISIAAGFLLRVIAGSYATKVEASVWILAVTFLLALFLALGKRKHELLVSQEKDGSRPVLRFYSPRLVKMLMNVVAVLTIAAYSAYALSTHTREYFETDYLFVSIPFVLFGLWRFIRLSDIKERNESPTEALIRDVPFILNGLLWFVVITAIIYFI